MSVNRWGYVCALIAMVSASAFVNVSAQSDPSTLPRIEFNDLVYMGAFRLPAQTVNGDAFDSGGYPITFNPLRNSLFVSTRRGNVGEVAIPTPVVSNDILHLPFATLVQGFGEPTEGKIYQVSTTDAALSGLLAVGDRLYGAAAIYYDANNTQRVSHFARSTNLNTPGVVGMKQVWLDEKSGFVSGYMATVPPEWQSRLGGPAITGQCCLPVTWRTSWGPSAFAFNPADINTHTKVPATPLLYYPHDHHTLGHWDASGPVYGGTTQITGVAILAGTRTALYFGRNGTGPFCYGNGTSNKSLEGTVGPDGEIFCYDPTSTAKGQHAYPYNYQIWAYDLNDLAAVKAGTKAAWDVKPYGVWPFGLPFPEPEVHIGGVGYDSSRQIIYVSQIYADKDGYGYRPVIHALKVGGGAVGTPLPDVDTTVLTPPSTTTPTSWTVSSVTIVPNRTAPQPVGTTVTWTATPTGGAGPHQYKWLQHDGAQWTAISSWSTSSTFNWTPPAANGAYRIGVWVKSTTNTADQAEATASEDFPISGGTTSTTTPTAPTGTSTYYRVNLVTMAPDRPAPQPAGTTIKWTATPSGGRAPYQYKWFTHDGAKWTVSGTWTTSNTFNWTPAVANGAYRVSVWVKSADNTADQAEETTSADYPISTGTSTTTPTTPPPTTTTPPPTTSTEPLRSVVITPNKAAPQPAGSTVTWTATTNGGTLLQYKWLVHNGASWTPVTDWSSLPTFAWTPALANPNYRVSVWVRSNGSTSPDPEVTSSADFPISTAVSANSVPPPTTTTSVARLTAVTIGANRAAPIAANTSVTFTATPTGGSLHQYQWLLHNGASWSTISSWATVNTFTWTPTVANANYRISVWVRSNGSTSADPEVTASVDFPVSTAATAPVPPPTTSVSRLTAVTIGANKIAPQPINTPVTFTALPTGGYSHQYQWLVHNGATWTPVSSWSSTNTFTWTPSIANPNYRVSVWVRSNGSTSADPEVTASVDFPINSGTAVVTAPTTTTIARLTAVSITANKIAPLPINTTVIFTATPNGGAAPHQYQWFVHNGAAWSVISPWSTSNTFAWTPTVANPNHRIAVWVRSAGNTGEPEATVSIDFPTR